MRTVLPGYATLLLLVTSLAMPVRAFTQIERVLGRPIAGVRVTIDGQASADTELRDVLETRVGDALDAAAVRESIVHLMSLNRFESVQADAQETAAGVILTYQLVPMRTVRGIDFRGQLGLPEDQLRSDIADRYGASPQPGRASDVAASLEDLYREHGYLRPSVTAHVVPQPRPERSTLRLDVVPGPQARIARIAFAEGDRRLNRDEVLRKLGLKAGAPYDPAAVTARVSAYADSWRAKGYYLANVSVTPRASADDENVSLDVVAARGPRVNVDVRGAEIPKDKRKELVPIGRENAIDSDLLEDWTSNLERYFQAQGYKDARAPYSREESPDGQTLTIAFSVAPGPRYVVDSIAVTGNRFLDRGTIVDTLGLRAGAPFVQRTVDAGVATILLQYQRAGFMGVRVKPGITVRARTGHEVRQTVDLAIVEGPRTLVQSVAFVCNGVPGRCVVSDGTLRGALLEQRALVPGTPLYLPDLERARDALLIEYHNRGYQSATVTLPPPDHLLNTDGTQANVRFEIQEGAQFRIDHILLVGNNRTKASTIRSELTFRSGDPLAYQRLAASQQRLAALGLFRRVRVTDLQHGTEAKRDVIVTVEESPPRSIAYGGGVEGGRRLQNVNGQAVSTTEIAPRALFDIGWRNLWGKNRSITFNTSIALRPTLSSGQVVGAGLTEYRALGTYREPRILGTTSDFLVTGGVEQMVRTSYSYNRQGVRAELSRRLSPTLTLYGRYSLDETRLLDKNLKPEDQIPVDRLFPQVRISRISASLVRDTRDDPIDPARGMLLSADGGLAPRVIGSEVGFTKALCQLFVYRRLPTARRIVFAGGARLGLASAFELVKNGEVTKEVPISERFFSGDTVRGFLRDALGPLNPDGFPQGGDAMMIVNGEMRISIWKGLAAVGFVDAGNIFARVHELDPTDIRPTLGFGARYKSPLGPIRFDLGFNPARRIGPAGGREPLTNWYVGIGQTF